MERRRIIETNKWYSHAIIIDGSSKEYFLCVVLIKETNISFHFSCFLYYFLCILSYNSCVADNSLGRQKKFMEVSGRPGPAEFHSAPWSRSPDTYNLTWKVDSYPPLQEVRLLYRKLMVS